MPTIAPLLTVSVGPTIQMDTDTPEGAAQVVANLVVQVINHRRAPEDRCGTNHLIVRFFHAIQGSVVLLNCGDVSLTLELAEDDIDHRDEEGLQEFVGDITSAIANHGPFSTLDGHNPPIVHCQVSWQRHLAREVLF